MKDKKKKIIFLFSGTSRTYPFGLNYKKRNQEILDSYNKFLFTEKFKNLYEYKIYISTDNLHLIDTINYFSINNIGNIHLHDTNFYLHNINQLTPDVNYFLDIYNKNHDKKYIKWESSIYQHYKILCCYNLLRNDNLNDYDYIVRLRMDTKINVDILDILDLFQNKPELELFMSWDLAAIGTPKIMNCYCTGLENNYGNYKNLTNVPDILPIIYNYKNLNFYIWMYAAERQLFEMLFEYCNNNNLDINKVINGFGRDYFCSIVR
jgi:hypothetical protein